MPGGVHQFKYKTRPDTYKSPYGPKYSVPRNLNGMTFKTLQRAAVPAAGFGAVAGIALLYFAEGIPRVQKDILGKVPGLGEYWMDREPPASDNPF